MAIQLKLLESPADHLALQAAQEAIWGEGSAVVMDQTLAACKFGGVAIGAFDGEVMAGFCYGFPAYDGQEVWLHSHLLGVLPPYRSQGLGARLKQAQREQATRLGYRRMTWTYDPLEAPNARLNIAKLGGVVRRYLVDCYGELPDALNAGIPTDRFLLEWDLTSSRTGGASPAAAEAINPDGLRIALGLEAPVLRLFIPGDIRQRYAAGQKEEVIAWRMAVREACLHYLDRGYVITDFAENAYVLRRGGPSDEA